ncbi:MAG TPA: Yip1 family protein [Cyclobacteriaceae bacterium]|nr:Yip1 family protein [Cyclobacteriaceae bacterium]
MNDVEQITNEAEQINPWMDIWTRPRQTIDWIIGNHSSLLTTLTLIYVGGVCFGIQQAEVKSLGDQKELSNILITSIFISGLGGLVIYNLWVFAIEFCSLLFGGKGNFKKTQTAFAWAMLPVIASLILTLIGYVLFGEELFASKKSNIDSSDFLTVSFWTYAIIKFLLGIWHLVLIIILVSQVQKLPVIKSAASIVMGFLLVVSVLVGIVFLLRSAI